MYKALVVDDEHFIRLGIKAMIERYKPNYFQVLTAANGVEALEIVKKDSIDLMITDIRMSSMDGIELIKNVQSFLERPEILILSGYSEFDYALQALKLGVRDYILKPIKREEFYKTLDKVGDGIKIKKTSILKNNQMKEYIDVFKKYQLNYLLLNSTLNEKELNNILKLINLPILKSKFYMAVVEKVEKSNNEDILMDVSRILNEFKDIDGQELFVFNDMKYNTVVLSHSVDAFDYMRKYFRDNNVCKYCITMYDSLINIYDIENVYRILKNISYYRFISRDENSIVYSYYQNRSEAYKLPIDKINLLYSLLGEAEDEKIDNLVAEILNFDEISKLHINYFLELYEELNKQLIASIKKKYFYQQNFDLGKYNRLENIDNYSSFYEYYHDFKGYIKYINKYIGSIKEVYHDKKNMDKAVEYINKNYDKDINLSMVSNFVSLNYSYFSQIFKEYTGESFVNYIKKIRIEKAKELLKDSPYKVYEIGEKVGYEDTKQFTKIFRKIVGISPKEYREKYNQD